MKGVESELSPGDMTPGIGIVEEPGVRDLERGRSRGPRLTKMPDRERSDYSKII